MNDITKHLDTLRMSGNLRSIGPHLSQSGLIDLSSNDYLGLAANQQLQNEFFSNGNRQYPMTASASRLLSLHQQSYTNLEDLLGSLYRRNALLFNSGYHANSGIIPAITSKNTLIVCDKLVHASIIDGIILSRARFVRFRHNDLDHLQEIIRANRSKHSDILVITESVFSMDGDICNLPLLVKIKKENPGTRLYVDEAHGFGVFGKRGLGVCERDGVINDIDIIIGTLGKAGASVGAFAITDAATKDFLINTARSFIFSTMLPPINCAWSQLIVTHIINMEAERKHLLDIARHLAEGLLALGYDHASQSQIVPLIVGDSHKVLELSHTLRTLGYIALPIRTPTVPAGTERIRFSLTATLPDTTIDDLLTDLKTLLQQ